MAKVPFKYYLQDTADWGERKYEIEKSLGRSISDELMDKISRPFYEVTLYCILDMETGAVTLERAEL